MLSHRHTGGDIDIHHGNPDLQTASDTPLSHYYLEDIRSHNKLDFASFEASWCGNLTLLEDKYLTRAPGVLLTFGQCYIMDVLIQNC